MADAVPTPTDPQEPIVTNPEGEKGDPDYKAKYEEALTHSRKWEGFAKRDKDDADSWRTHQESLKSQEQQNADREAAAQAKAEESARELALYKAGLKFGLSEDDLALLEGIPAESVAARAEQLASRIATQPPTTGAVRADHSQGTKSTVGESDPAQAFAQALNQARGR